MTSQSLPPPPLSSGTPPPMDFGSEDDEYPYPDEDEHYDDGASFNDDVIPVPDDVVLANSFNPIKPAMQRDAVALGEDSQTAYNHIGNAQMDSEPAVADNGCPIDTVPEEPAEVVMNSHPSSPAMIANPLEEQVDTNNEIEVVPIDLNFSPNAEESPEISIQAPVIFDNLIDGTPTSSDNEVECIAVVEDAAGELDFKSKSLETPAEGALEMAETDIPQGDCDFGDFVEGGSGLIEDPIVSRGLQVNSNDEVCDVREVNWTTEERPEESAVEITQLADRPVISESTDQLSVEDGNIEDSGSPPQEDNDFAADFNQFANFDDFSAVAVPTNQSNTEFVQSNTQLEDDSDDDEFGDFASSAPAPMTIPELQPLPQDHQIAEIDITKAEDILQLMFTATAKVVEPQKNVKAKPLVDVRGFEATALTNGYQWAKSHSNKCLVKCLGIDTRNILYGTNWNPDMPRFAANLGFSPLQPIKPIAAAMPTTTTSAVVATNAALTSPLPISSTLSANVAAPAPPIFDWDSSGLVNPLHVCPACLTSVEEPQKSMLCLKPRYASQLHCLIAKKKALQAHTLLLDLEQLVVVASLENTKTASNSTAPAAMAVPTNGIVDAGSSICGGGGAPTDNRCSRPCQGILGGGGGGGSTVEESAFFRHIIKTEEDRYSPFEAIRMESCYELTQKPSSIQALRIGSLLMAGASQSPELGQEDKDKITIEELEPEGAPPLSQVKDPSELLPPHFTSPLRETHIFTPVTGISSVSREIIPAVEGTAADGIVVKEYRDVEYDPIRFLEDAARTLEEAVTDPAETIINPETSSPAIIGAPSSSSDMSRFPPAAFKTPLNTASNKASQFSIDDDDEDDFSEFQSVPAPSLPPLIHPAQSAVSVGDPRPVAAVPSKATPSVYLAPIPNANVLQPLSVTNLTFMKPAAKTNPASTLGTNHPTGADILMPNILMPQPARTSALPSKSSMSNADIRWPDNSTTAIGKSELDRIDELFANKNDSGAGSRPGAGHLKTGSIKPTDVGLPSRTAQDDDEWTDFISGDITAPAATNGEDEWTDFVSSGPSGPNFTPWQAAPTPSSYQFKGALSKTNDGQPELKIVDPSPFFISSAPGLPSMFGGIPMDANRNKANK